MPVLETIGFQATAPDSAGAAASVFTGDTPTVRGAPGTTGARILGVTGYVHAPGFAQIVRASGHDQIRGARYLLTPGSQLTYLLPATNRLSPPGETLAVTIAGSATAGTIERAFIHVFYDNLPNMTQDLVDYDYVRAQAAAEVTVYASLTLGTAGGWSGEEPLTAESDLLRADRRYALLGMASSSPLAVPYIRGPGTAGLRIAAQADVQTKQFAPHWWMHLSRITGLPVIPVLHGASRNGWFLGASTDQSGSAATITLHMVELPPA